MTAFIECGICGKRLGFDTRSQVCPEVEGWAELPIQEVSVRAYMERISEIAPVCPDCLKTHAILASIYDPFGG